MSRQLTVVHVVRAFQTGGLETLALEACAHMQRLDGVAVSVCALLPGDGLEQRPEYHGVPCTVLTARQRRDWATTVLALGALFRRERPDVVHIHNWFSHVRAAPAARLAGVPVVVHTKHGAEWPFLLGSRALAGRLYRMADVVVAVSADVRDGLLSTYRFPSERIRLVLNGIDTDRFCPLSVDLEHERRRVLGLNGAPLLGAVSRLSPEKGIVTLLGALRIVRDRLPGTRLVVAGDGPDRRRCEEEARTLGVADEVAFLGSRSDVDAIYPVLDIYVQPSYAEGMSLTILEACSCGLPVVATAVGGNPEIIEDGKTGRLVAPRDPEALAAAILEHWENVESARAMGCAARERIVGHFSLDRMVRGYVALYREIYERKLRSRRKAVFAR